MSGCVLVHPAGTVLLQQKKMVLRTPHKALDHALIGMLYRLG